MNKSILRNIEIIQDLKISPTKYTNLFMYMVRPT